MTRSDVGVSRHVPAALRAAAAALRVPADGTILSHGALQSIHAIVLQEGIDRDALLSCLPQPVKASLPSAPSPAAQLLCDLQELNEMGRLSNGSRPLLSVIETAIHLAAQRRSRGIGPAESQGTSTMLRVLSVRVLVYAILTAAFYSAWLYVSRRSSLRPMTVQSAQTSGAPLPSGILTTASGISGTQHVSAEPAPAAGTDADAAAGPKAPRGQATPLAPTAAARGTAAPQASANAWHATLAVTAFERSKITVRGTSIDGAVVAKFQQAPADSLGKETSVVFQLSPGNYEVTCIDGARIKKRSVQIAKEGSRDATASCTAR